MLPSLQLFKDKTVLITGGTGSFGHTVVKKFIDTEVREIRIFSRDEKKQDDMRHAIQSRKLKFYVGDVRDQQSVDNAMHGVDYVFHAAALKQVPSCEFYPIEAVKTNILGTENVLNSAIKYDIKKLICLSTDKAVYPINAMGISKALMEKIVMAKSRAVDKAGPTFCITRYGNVMASRGSVIPLFVEQIKGGRPITITDPDMTRFMMSLDEAVDLVLFAFVHGSQGELFVQKAPAATIGTTAAALREILGSTNEIRIIGTRHGEKKHEVLLSREECVRSVEVDNFFKVSLDDRDLNYNLYFTEGKTSISNRENYASDNTYQLSHEELVQKLMALDYIQNELNGRT